MNKLIQTVTLCADPEIKSYGDGKSLVNFNGAVNRRFKKDGDPDADFFKYTAFGKTAEFIAKYFKKGSKMLMTGELQNNNYEKDGVKHYGVQIIIDSVEFFGKKSDGENNANTESTPATPANSGNANTAPATTSSYDEYDDF